MSDERDEELLRELAEAAKAIDPVPDHWSEVARSSLAWRTVDAELARLVHDSTAPTAIASGVRASSDRRQLAYTAGNSLLDVEVTPEGDGLLIIGQVTPGRIYDVTVRFPSGRSVTTATDEIGRFGFEGLTNAPLAIEVSGTPPLWTGLILP